jgi:hypothetical protein
MKIEHKIETPEVSEIRMIVRNPKYNAKVDTQKLKICQQAERIAIIGGGLPTSKMSNELVCIFHNQNE